MGDPIISPRSRARRAVAQTVGFHAVCLIGLLDGSPPSADIEHALVEPFCTGGTVRRYRFPRQKARYLSGCLRALHAIDEPKDDTRFRDTLASLPGIGLKTASWIVRNYRQSNNVAIVDVHILRAGRYLGLYPSEWSPQKHYRKLEELFLQFSRAINTASGMLDALMWDYMRRAPISRALQPSAQYQLL